MKRGRLVKLVDHKMRLRGADSKDIEPREGWNGNLLLYQPGGIDGNEWRSSVVRGNVVFVMLLKMNCDLILIKSINSHSHLNCYVAVTQENNHARRTLHTKLRRKPAHKTSLNGMLEDADQFK